MKVYVKVENCKMVNYNNGKIYKIVNELEPDKFYVGSTTLPLSRRMAEHRAHTKKGTSFFYTEIRQVGIKHFHIVLIHDFLCSNVEQLRAEEERVRRELKPYYNMRRAFQTEEEKKEHKKKYYEQNKDKVKDKIKEYYEQNKDKIRYYQKEYREWKKNLIVPFWVFR